VPDHAPLARVRLLLCAWHEAGCLVLEHARAREDVTDLAVLTHPPAPGVPDVAERARRLGVWCSLEDVNAERLPFRPDVVALVWYRNLVRAPFLASVGGRVFNAHPSLLPRHRGCSSVPWAILEGDERTGVTFHYVDTGIDTGPILLQAPLDLRPGETQSTLYPRLMALAASRWPDAFERVKAGEPGVPQSGAGCYHRRGPPEGGAIGEGWPDEKVERFLRAMTYPPLPGATFRGVPVATLEEYRRVLGGRRPR
jgi:methionyl-tRNA formyltransferase